MASNLEDDVIDGVNATLYGMCFIVGIYVYLARASTCRNHSAGILKVSHLMLLATCAARFATYLTPLIKENDENLCKLRSKSLVSWMAVLGFTAVNWFMISFTRAVVSLSGKSMSRSTLRLWHTLNLGGAAALVFAIVVPFKESGHNSNSPPWEHLLLSFPLFALMMLFCLLFLYIRDNLSGAFPEFADTDVMVAYAFCCAATALRLVLKFILLYFVDVSASTICDSNGLHSFLAFSFGPAIELAVLVVPALFALWRAYAIEPMFEDLSDLHSSNLVGLDVRSEDIDFARAHQAQQKQARGKNIVFKVAFYWTVFCIVMALVGFNFSAIEQKKKTADWLKDTPGFVCFLLARVAAGCATLFTALALLGILRVVSHALLGRIVGPSFASNHAPLEIHIIAGALVIFSVFVHVGAHYAAPYNVRRPTDEVSEKAFPDVYRNVGKLTTSYAGITGIIMCLSLSAIAATGIMAEKRVPWLTRRLFNYIHGGGVFIYIFFYSVHGYSEAFEVTPFNGLVIGVVGMMALLLFILFRCLFPPEQVDVEVAETKGEISVIRFARPDSWGTTMTSAGQFLLVGCDRVGRTKIHPFSLVNNTNLADPGFIELHIKKSRHPNAWTNRLWRLCNGEVLDDDDMSVVTEMHAAPHGYHGLEHGSEALMLHSRAPISKLSTRGPFNGPISAAFWGLGGATPATERLLLVGSGVGVTPVLSCLNTVLRMLAAEPNRFPKLVHIGLIQTGKNSEYARHCFDMVRNNCEHVASTSGIKEFRRVSAHFWVTGNENRDLVDTVEWDHEGRMQVKIDWIDRSRNLTSEDHYLNDVFGEPNPDDGREVLALFCGQKGYDTLLKDWIYRTRDKNVRVRRVSEIF